MAEADEILALAAFMLSQSLLGALVDKGILSASDAQEVVANAAAGCRTQSYEAGDKAAITLDALARHYGERATTPTGG